MRIPWGCGVCVSRNRVEREGNGQRWESRSLRIAFLPSPKHPYSHLLCNMTSFQQDQTWQNGSTRFSQGLLLWLLWATSWRTVFLETAWVACEQSSPSLTVAYGSFPLGDPCSNISWKGLENPFLGPQHYSLHSPGAQGVPSKSCDGWWGCQSFQERKLTKSTIYSEININDGKQILLKQLYWGMIFHTVKFTHFMYIVQRFLVNLLNCATIAMIQF